MTQKKDNYSIKVRDLSKSFRVYHDKTSTFKERILLRTHSYTEHKVLNSISLDIKWGQTIGLIGRNGSGKSTFLKLLTGIIYPDEGTIDIFGKVSSLLELGAGFHPDFSGRENVYNNAAIFGLSRKEISEKFSTILDFSELYEYIDNPVRTYSSGMYMRLAFSVAINVEAEIILVDEILSVGDASFQVKCYERVKELQRDGKTIVIVTHSMDVVKQFCDYAVWLDDGIIRLSGNPESIVEEYKSVVK